MPCTPQSDVLSLAGKCTRSGWPSVSVGSAWTFSLTEEKVQGNMGKAHSGHSFPRIYSQCSISGELRCGRLSENILVSADFVHVKLLDSVQGIPVVKYQQVELNKAFR